MTKKMYRIGSTIFDEVETIDAVDETETHVIDESGDQWKKKFTTFPLQGHDRVFDSKLKAYEKLIEVIDIKLKAIDQILNEWKGKKNLYQNEKRTVEQWLNSKKQL